jgi:hypothetical protein
MSRLRRFLSLSAWWLVPILVVLALLVLLVLLLDTDRTFPILYPAQ